VIAELKRRKAQLRMARRQREYQVRDLDPPGPKAVKDVGPGGCGVQPGRPALGKKAANHLDLEENSDGTIAVCLIIGALDRKSRASGECDEAYGDWRAVERQHVGAASRIGILTVKRIKREYSGAFIACERAPAFSFPAARLHFEKGRHRTLELFPGTVAFVSNFPELFETATVAS